MVNGLRFQHLHGVYHPFVMSQGAQRSHDGLGQLVAPPSLTKVDLHLVGPLSAWDSAAGSKQRANSGGAPDLQSLVGERGASLVGRCPRWARPSTQQVLPLISGAVEPDGGGEEPEEPVWKRGFQ